MNRPWTLALLLPLAVCGCRHYPQAPQPIDPLPHDWAHAAPPPQLLEQVELLTEKTNALTQRQDQIESALAARNDELQRTRTEHQRALDEIAEVRRELSRWRTALAELQFRLGEQDEQRLEVLGELADRINDVSRAIERR